MSGQTSKPAVKNRRRRKFIRPDMQLKVVFITLFVTCVTLLVQMKAGLASVEEVSRNLNEDLTVFQVLNFVEASIFRGFFLSLMVALPVTVVCGVLYSFRFAGPVYRFQQYFAGLRGGRWDTPCRLRKDDHLQDVAESINGAMDDARARMFEDQAILHDVKQLLTSTVFTTDESSQQLVASLHDRIASAERDFQRRFPGADASRPFVPAEASGDRAAIAGTHERGEAAGQPVVERSS